ncbi:hypothetical protein SKAU_G00022770 [Synaphobranchus kaupii]|uniref:Uncharacterized protein n=1 Tax=Synaphobranchus kaupii TaxID=118154 RepID=A0A9Q1GC79_SYNKA|nr:hypothetical protein SKAU_G00022770 [Synaphobranchus kaupii]
MIGCWIAYWCEEVRPERVPTVPQEKPGIPMRSGCLLTHGRVGKHKRIKYLSGSTDSVPTGMRVPSITPTTCGMWYHSQKASWISTMSPQVFGNLT